MKVKNLLLNKKSQAWAIDITIGVIIFFIGAFVFFLYSINQQDESKEILEHLNIDGKIISEMLLSEGYPQNWNKDNVVRIGLLSNNKINQTKLENFYELVKNDYQSTKKKFNTKYDYYIFFDEKININGEEIDGIGASGVNRDNILSKNPQNLIKITRIVYYNKKIQSLYIYIWEK